MATALILEDDHELALTLRNWLEHAGHDVQWCSNGAEVLREIETRAYDIIIADMYIYEDGRLSQNGGMSVIGALRMGRFNMVRKTAWDVPILAISGAVTDPKRKYALEAAQTLGAHITLVKPFDQVTFLRAVKELLSGPSLPPQSGEEAAQA